jgi:hypothetical protein
MHGRERGKNTMHLTGIIGQPIKLHSVQCVWCDLLGPGRQRSERLVDSASEGAEMISRTPTLAEWPYGIVRLVCGLCPRRGEYRKGTLIARFGGDVKMPDLRHLIARCPRKDAPGAVCGVYYADLRERSE